MECIGNAKAYEDGIEFDWDNKASSNWSSKTMKQNSKHGAMRLEQNIMLLFSRQNVRARDCRCFDLKHVGVS